MGSFVQKYRPLKRKKWRFTFPPSPPPRLAAVPAKTQTSKSNVAILRNPCAIMRLPPVLCSRFLFSPVPELSSSSRNFLNATPSQKYLYPDPIPEFAVAETRKFKDELLKKLSKDKVTFGNDLGAVVDTCVEIFSEFLHKEYGGPGTLLVEPFTYMLIALKEKKLPGGPAAARASLLWAQNNVDQDWENWNSKPPEREKKSQTSEQINNHRA